MTGVDAGYDVFDTVFERAEMAEVLASLDRATLVRTKAGVRHVLSLPGVQDLARDARMVRLASSFVGQGAVPFRATLFDKSPRSNWLIVWHQDTALPLRERLDDPSWGPWSVKGGVRYAHAPAWALDSVVALRVQLDDSTASNGPLRVLPGTHREGVLTDARVQQLAEQIPSVACVTDAGGVIAMRPLTIHASSKSTNDRPRRVLHIEYAAGLELRPGVHLAVA
jgi:hypothetical protein